MAATPLSAAAFSAGSFAEPAKFASSPRASRSPRAAMMPIAFVFSAAGRSERSTAAARACSNRAFTCATVSAAIALSSAGICFGSALWKSVSAAARRFAGSFARSVSVPSASPHGDADGILDLDLPDRPVRRLPGLLAGDRVVEFVAAASEMRDEDPVVALPGIEVALGQRPEGGRHGRIARARQPVDKFLDVGEAAGLPKGLDEVGRRLRKRGHRAEEQQQDGDEKGGAMK